LPKSTLPLPADLSTGMSREQRRAAIAARLHRGNAEQRERARALAAAAAGPPAPASLDALAAQFAAIVRIRQHEGAA